MVYLYIVQVMWCVFVMYIGCIVQQYVGIVGWFYCCCMCSWVDVDEVGNYFICFDDDGGCLVYIVVIKQYVWVIYLVSDRVVE